MFVVIIFSNFLFSQGSNWKQIASPFKCQVNITTYNNNGVAIGNLNNYYLGNAISMDDGITWNFINENVKYGKFDLNNDNIGVTHTYKSLFKFNFNTSMSYTYEGKFGFLNFCKNARNNFVIYNDNNNYLGVSDFVSKLSEINIVGNKKILILNNAEFTVSKVLVYTSNGIYLYNISDAGIFDYKNTFALSTDKYFVEGNSLVRNTQHSEDNGKTFTAYNVPFTKPDSIYNYNGNLAYAFNNKIYYKNGLTSDFKIIDLPSDVDLKNLIIGKSIIVKKLVNGESTYLILRNPNGVFEPMNFSMDIPFVQDFAAGRNERITVSNQRDEVYAQDEQQSSYKKTGLIARYNFFYNLPKQYTFSYNRDNVLSLQSVDGFLYNSTDDGISWIKDNNIDSTYYGILSQNKLGSFCSNRTKLFFRKLNSTTWQKYIELPANTYQQFGIISNQHVSIYPQPFTEQIYVNDFKGNAYGLVDVPRTSELKFDLHYEMNYFYHFTNYFKNNDYQNYIRKPLLSRSYTNGSKFETVNDPDTISSEYYVMNLWSGHLLQVYQKSLNISNDYGFTWKPIPLDLIKSDLIQDVVISPDNYLYISTANKGILKLVDSLPLANIIRFNIKEDFFNDCSIGNDTIGLERIKVSLDDQATQLTDENGNAVFYTFRKNNKLIIHNDEKILNICQDTIPILFSEESALEKQVFANASLINICPKLSLKFVSYNDKINNYTYYTLVVQNTGNASSSPSQVKIVLDPYQYLSYKHPYIEMINSKTLVYNIPSLKPGGSFGDKFYIDIKPDTPFDAKICTTAQMLDYTNQCTPNEIASVCLLINRNEKNKTIKVQYYQDTNGNCTMDVGENIIHEKFNLAFNSNYVYLNYDSTLYVQTSQDTNAIKIHYNKDLYTLCQDSFYVYIPKDSLNYTLNIPVKNINKCSVLGTSFGWGRMTRCFDSNLQFYVRNHGNKNSENVDVEVELDSYLEVLKVNPAPYKIIGHTYYFNVGSIAFDDFVPIKFDVHISCDAPLGFKHCNKINLTENPELCSLNTNASTLCVINGGSFDPNDKSILVSGKENISTITKDDKIEYKIRFQNTGTDTAYTVRIEDYLSSSFDIGSMQLVHSTHPCRWKILNNMLRIEFQNINLVDSFTNEPGSHGEVLFSIKLKQNTKIGDQIRNKAYIYFDFNTPVETNEVVNVFGKTTSIKELANNEITTIKFVPNPTINEAKIIGINISKKHTLSIYNTIGNLIGKQSLSEGQEHIDISKLTSGTYIISVFDGHIFKYGKIVKI